MSDRGYLFWAEPPLRDYLEQRLAALKVAVDAVPEDHAWQADPEAWAAALVQNHAVQVPSLGETWMDRPEETKVDVAGRHFTPGRDIRDRSQPVYVPGYRVTFHIPFTGEPEVFKRRTSTYTARLCDGSVHGSELVMTIEYVADTPADLDGEAGRWFRDVERWLSWAIPDVEAHNRRLERETKRFIEQRRGRIERHHEQLAQTTTPIGPPEERDKVVITDAIVRRPSPVLKLAPRTTPPRPQPIDLQPTLIDDVYEHILEVIRDTGRSMERAPKTYAAMDEEARRDVLVNNLNTHYRGQTTAEAFNRSGHTDILVSYENKTLFIGECKIWHGSTSLIDAVDQLFGYTGWRDTKTALVFFVGEVGFTEIVGKAREALASHRQFNGWADEGESEFRATLSWPDDEQREIAIALTLFHVQA